MDVTTAIKTRISTRAFRPDALPELLVREILEVARWAPSGGNTQPWKVVAVAGRARDEIVALAEANPGASEAGERPVYPEQLWEPYRTRRHQVGEDMYALLGIAREDRPARLRRMGENYRFFGAPAALFFVIDRRLGYGQWAHLGMFMQSLALAAWERGVASCMQEAWANYRESLARHFGLPEHELVYCGMALGYADEAAAVNRLRSRRAPVDEFASFSGFAEP